MQEFAHILGVGLAAEVAQQKAEAAAQGVEVTRLVPHLEVVVAQVLDGVLPDDGVGGGPLQPASLQDGVGGVERPPQQEVPLDAAQEVGRPGDGSGEEEGARQLRRPLRHGRGPAQPPRQDLPVRDGEGQCHPQDVLDPVEGAGPEGVEGDEGDESAGPDGLTGQVSAPQEVRQDGSAPQAEHREEQHAPQDARLAEPLQELVVGPVGVLPLVPGLVVGLEGLPLSLQVVPLELPDAHAPRVFPEHGLRGGPDADAAADGPGVLDHVPRLGDEVAAPRAVDRHGAAQHGQKEQERQSEAQGVDPAEARHGHEAQHEEPGEQREYPGAAGAVPEAPDVDAHQEQVQDRQPQGPSPALLVHGVSDEQVDGTHDTDGHPEAEHVLLGGVPDVVARRRQDDGAQGLQARQGCPLKEFQPVQPPDLQLREQDVDRPVDVGQPQDRPEAPVGEGIDAQHVEGPHRRQADELVQHPRRGGDGGPERHEGAVNQHQGPDRPEEVHPQRQAVPAVSDEAPARRQEGKSDGEPCHGPLHDVQRVGEPHAGVDQVGQDQGHDPERNQDRRGDEGHRPPGRDRAGLRLARPAGGLHRRIRQGEHDLPSKRNSNPEHSRRVRGAIPPRTGPPVRTPTAPARSAPPGRRRR